MQTVSVILHTLAKVVWVAVPAEVANAARHVRRRHDPVADPKFLSLTVKYASAERSHGAHVLVPADERVGEVLLMRRAGVLLALSTKRMLIGPTYARVTNLHDDRAGTRFRHRELLHGNDARVLGHGRAHETHVAFPSV